MCPFLAVSTTLQNSDALHGEINSVFIFHSWLAFGSNIWKCGAHLCFLRVIFETGSVLAVKASMLQVVCREQGSR